MDSVFISNPNPSNVSAQNLPHDIIIDILTKLPVKSLIRFKNACKSWYSLIKDDKFVKQHYDTHKNCQKYFMVSSKYNMKHQFYCYHYTMDVPQLDSSSNAFLLESPVPINESPTVYPNIQYFSSNGILLIRYFDDIIVMWNPTTRESRRIPSPFRNKCGGFYDFCYFPRIDEYKIFRPGGYKEIDIFSTKNGVIYMMASRTENGDRVITIVRFCLEKEQFQDELLFPCMVEGRRPILYCVGEKLCLTMTFVDYEFWLYTMKTNSWNKISTMSYNIWLKPLCFMKDGNMMFQRNNSSGFVAYNSITHELEQVNVIGIEANLYFNKVVTYVETLSSPNC
ncbi:hypothetical protein H5410_059690 [Solanum commersonii]|uniref:F-box domain-containing protein n=1 Tax=Solanum commersonii TaxID=4109 RepID=A0A9J5W3Q6_SOLCO|nr:hypothetical protein H5410_059690 [Solanum commersonii]